MAILGVIKDYDYKTKTASIVTVDKFPVVLPAVPVWSILTNDSIFNIPLTPGTSGVILFCDIDTTDFFVNGNVAVEFVEAFQSEYKNAIFIPGFNSLVQEYDVEEKAIHIQRGDMSIKLFDDYTEFKSKSSSINLKDKEINMSVNSNSEFNILDGGKFEIKNTTGEALTLLSDNMQHLSDAINALLTATVPTAIGPSPLDPATITALTNVKLTLDTITKTKFDTFV